MQSCSIHHCVLLLLTLTFTTAPVAAGDCPTLAKLHHRVTLPCTHDCSGETKWTLYSDRKVVFARCDQTSCSSVEKGYEMSHDQYLKGDLSLTITSAEYSMRNTYACECRTKDYSTVRLSIETVFSAVQKNPGGDLILDLSVPEPVEVIYTSSDSADGEQICNVTQHSLQCKAEYTHRTSLRYPELTLRDVMYSDSGRYTIRNTENKEDIHVYAVSVTGLSKGMTALIVLLVLVLVLVICGVIIYKWTAAEKMRRAEEEKLRAAEEEDRKMENEMEAVHQKIRQLFKNNPEEIGQRKDHMDEVERMIEGLEQRYRENSKYSDRVTLFCDKKRTELIFCRTSSEQDVSPENLIEMMEQVVKGLEHLISSPNRFMYICIDSHLTNIKSWCSKMRQSENFKKEHGAEANVNMEALLSAYEKWCKEKETELKKHKEQADRRISLTPESQRHFEFNLLTHTDTHTEPLL